MGRGVKIREAREEDVDDVAAFTRDTWPDREYEDYLPRVFPRWIASDEPDRHTLVAAMDGRAVGVVQTVLLTEFEAWQQGLRVHPDHRGEGIARELTEAGFEWARGNDRVVARSMVFSWNAQGLGLARSVGYDPVTEFRRATPEPRAREPGLDIDDDPDAAWRFWNDCAAREHLGGLAFDPGESWATSLLTREHLRAAAEDERLLVVKDGGTRGFANRIRVSERESADGTERIAEYGVAAWEGAGAASALVSAIANDAFEVDADAVRVPIPATVEAASDAALAGVDLSGEGDYVLAADLTDGPED